eukprot:m.292010 g.292010  ORF g.292010 m.292010 type:complete len:420 (+) comp12552_c0_seq1:306-1565(+)
MSVSARVIDCEGDVFAELADLVDDGTGPPLVPQPEVESEVPLRRSRFSAKSSSNASHRLSADFSFLQETWLSSSQPEPREAEPPMTRVNGLVIGAKFFEDAAEMFRSAVIDTFQKQSDEVKQPFKLLWRRRLKSPLGNFLTGARNQEEWVQLAGHKDNFVPGLGQGTICKKGSEMERNALEALMGDVLAPYVPLFYKEVEMGEEGEIYLEMEDLLTGFEHPCVMDVKMGIRTFRETEVKKKDRRKDLLKKMLDLSPEEATEEEHEKGITKLRYMLFRERLSSTRNMGFRVEGTKMPNKAPRTDFKTVRTREDCIAVLHSYLPPRAHREYSKIRTGLLDRLLDLQDTLKQSEFFWNHELIGSSLLFIYDHTGKVGIWMIDFGKTSKVESPITHREDWVLGNHEDGYLIGLENLIEIFRSS